MHNTIDGFNSTPGSVKGSKSEVEKALSKRERSKTEGREEGRKGRRMSHLWDYLATSLKLTGSGVVQVAGKVGKEGWESTPLKTS